MKILFVLDFPKMEHIREANGKKVFDYGSSKFGKQLKRKLSPLGLKERVNYYFMYLYPNIPPADKTTSWGKILSYKTPSKKALAPYLDRLKDVVKKHKPDLVVPIGSSAVKELTGGVLKVNQGVPSKVDYKGFSQWTLPLYSEEYLEVNPNRFSHQNLAMSLLGRFLKNGEQVFDTEYVPYHEILTMADVKKYLSKPKETKEMAWDLETNTLRADLKGAKVLVFSFSWKPGYAAAIPIEHREYYNKDHKDAFGEKALWTDEDLQEIWKTIFQVLSDPTIQKVGHNIQFDEHFLMSTHDFHDFKQVCDTKVGYWLEVDQSSSETKRLSVLAPALTVMGGYDEPLENYKKWLVNEVFKKTDNLMKERIGTGKKKLDHYEITLEDRKELFESINWQFLKDNSFYTDRIVKWVLDIITIPLFNECQRQSQLHTDVHDGGNFTYDWIPMEVMYYYAAGDADCCLRIHHRIEEMMDKDESDPHHKLKSLYLGMYSHLVTGLASLESNGIAVNREYIKVISDKYAEQTKIITDNMRKEIPEVQDIEAEREHLYELGVEEFAKPKEKRNPDIVAFRGKYKGEKSRFNPKSPVDKGLLLFKKLKIAMPYDKNYLKKDSKNKGEDELAYDDYSTDKKVLAWIDENTKDPKVEKVIWYLTQYSKVSTLRSGFTTKLEKLISDKDNRVHGSFNATGTQTGRLSASNPRLKLGL